MKILNLFAYTGGATCAAAKAGAHVTHVDASKGMVAGPRKMPSSPDCLRQVSAGLLMTARSL